MGDDKALAIAAYGEAVAVYRYIVLAEKARTVKLRDAFEGMAVSERHDRDRIQGLLAKFAPSHGFYLSSEDKLAVCVGPRLFDPRDEARFDEAMRLVIASEKRAASFYQRYVAFAKDPEVAALFAELGAEEVAHIQRLRVIAQDNGKPFEEPCPMEE